MPASLRGNAKIYILTTNGFKFTITQNEECVSVKPYSIKNSNAKPLISVSSENEKEINIMFHIPPEKKRGRKPKNINTKENDID